MARIINGFVDINGGDVLSSSKKSELVNNINSNLTINSTRKLGYRTTSTDVSRSDVSVVGSAYDTSGNGGRKLVRLANGTLVSIMKNGNLYYLQKSTDNGATWTGTSVNDSATVSDVSIVAVGNVVHGISNYGGNTVESFRYDYATNNFLGGFPKIDQTQTALGNCSLEYSPSDNTLHATWSSKNASYPNSFNIRYAKGTILGDGSVTWGSVNQNTNGNTVGHDYKNPCIIVGKNGTPVIFAERVTTNPNYSIICMRTDISFNVVNGWGWVAAYDGSTYTQSSPSAIFVPQSINGLANGRIWVAWEGYDSTDTTTWGIKVSYSDDGGFTWSAMTKITSVATDGTQFQMKPSMTFSKNGDVWLLWHGGNSSSTSYRIRSTKYSGGSWGAKQEFVSGTPNMQFASALVDLSISFTSPLFIYKDTSKVGFYGTWTEVTEIAANPSIPTNNQVFNVLSSLAGDALTETEKTSLLTQYNSNITTGIQNQLGYLPSYGPTTNPSRSAVQVINSAYDTSGNGGRKLTRLSNGWLVSAVYSANTIYFYISKDNGATFTLLGNKAGDTHAGWSIASKGTIVYLLGTRTNDNMAFVYKFDATEGTGVGVGGLPSFVFYTVDSGQTSVGQCSLTYSPTDNTLHAAWASKNGTLSSSFNIRYAKGTINGDGSVTWGSVTQVSTENLANRDVKNPSVTLQGTNVNITAEYSGSASSNSILNYRFNGTSWATHTIYTGTTYTQSSPSATVDGNGHIHVVWHGMDATDLNFYNVRYSKSTDGGVTWSAMTKLTSGNTYGQTLASITCDSNNNLYVYWQGVTATSGGWARIRSISYTGSWGSITDITSNSTANNIFPSLCDNLRTFTSPLVIWQDNVSPSVKFSGTWTDTPIISETISIDAVSNRVLIDAIVNRGINVKKSVLTVTSASGVTSLTISDGTTQSTPYMDVDLSVLGFTPDYILITNINEPTPTVWYYDNIYQPSGSSYANSFRSTYRFRTPYVNGVVRFSVGTQSTSYSVTCYKLK